MARAHLELEPEEVVRGEEERRAEALDLERPSELAAEAVGDAVRAEDDEREEDERDHAHEHAEADERLAAAAPLPDVRRARAARAPPGRAWRRRRARESRSRAGGAPRAAPRARPGRARSARGRSGSRRPSRAGAGRRRSRQGRRRPSSASPRARPGSGRRSTIASAPQSAIVPSKACRKAGWSPLSLRSAGSTNIGSAAGGYSSRKSRYGIEPPLDRVPVRLVHRQVDDLRVVVPATVQSGERRHEEEQPPRAWRG